MYLLKLIFCVSKIEEQVKQDDNHNGKMSSPLKEVGSDVEQNLLPNSPLIEHVAPSDQSKTKKSPKAAKKPKKYQATNLSMSFSIDKKLLT